MGTGASISTAVCLGKLSSKLRNACFTSLFLLLTLPAWVQAQFTYVTTNGTITITGYTGPSGDVQIPSTINGLPVTIIGDYSFWECTNLTSVTIPESVTSIGKVAFYCCNRLTTVTIPDSVTNVGSGAFASCASLITINVGPLNPSYAAVDGILFDRTQATLIQYPGGKTGSYIIPNSVTSIGEWAFENCSRLSSIAIPNVVTNIGWGGFADCTALSEINIPESVTSIGGVAFWKCTNLTRATIPDGITSIEDGTFGGCTSLAGFTIPNSVITIGEGAFNFCTNLTSIVIPHTVSSIGGRAFATCTSLTNVTIGSGVTTIGFSGFEYCTTLTSLTIPDNVTNIGAMAFALCLNLTNVSIGAGVKTLGHGSFYDCGSLTSIWIPKNVVSIGELAFSGCVNLTRIIVDAANSAYSSVNGVLYDKGQATLFQFPPGNGGSYTVPDSVTTIGRWAFSACANLTSVTIPKSVTNIGDEAFSACATLRAILVDVDNPVYSSADGVLLDKSQSTLIRFPGGKGGSYSVPPSVESILRTSFYGCASLTSVTIHTCVTFIGEAAFANCSSLAAITVDAANAAFSSLDGVLFDKSHATLIQFPAGKGGRYAIPSDVVSIGDYSFYLCDKVTEIVAPDSITSLGFAAFSYCGSLTGAYFQGNAPTVRNPSTDPFLDSTNAIIYRLPGTTGWSDSFCGRPTVLWVCPNPLILSRSVGANANELGFTISWATNIPVIIEVSTNLANPIWVPVGTNTLTGGTSYFSDAEWMNYPSRFYRIRSL